jgi:hypothetical protein
VYDQDELEIPHTSKQSLLVEPNWRSEKTRCLDGQGTFAELKPEESIVVVSLMHEVTDPQRNSRRSHSFVYALGWIYGQQLCVSDVLQRRKRNKRTVPTVAPNEKSDGEESVSYLQDIHLLDASRTGETSSERS